MNTPQQKRASPAASAVVRGYREQHDDAPVSGVIVPLPGRPAQFLEIYQQASYRVSVDGGDFDHAPEAVVVGASSRHSTRLWVEGRISVFHIAFQPTGFHRLFGVPMSELTDCGTPVEALGLPALTELVDVVRLQTDFESRTAAADAWLAHRLAWMREGGAVDHLARLIRRAGFAPPVSEMADRVGLSARQLQRAFINQVGLAPKLYARTVRFNAVLEARERRNDASWADLAQQFGYFDQSHLLRDARQFMGRAPTTMSDSS